VDGTLKHHPYVAHRHVCVSSAIVCGYFLCDISRSAKVTVVPRTRAWRSEFLCCLSVSLEQMPMTLCHPHNKDDYGGVIVTRSAFGHVDLQRQVDCLLQR